MGAKGYAIGTASPLPILQSPPGNELGQIGVDHVRVCVRVPFEAFRSGVARVPERTRPRAFASNVPPV